MTYRARVATKLGILHPGNMIHCRREQTRLCLSAMISPLVKSNSESEGPQRKFPIPVSVAARAFPQSIQATARPLHNSQVPIETRRANLTKVYHSDLIKICQSKPSPGSHYRLVKGLSLRSYQDLPIEPIQGSRYKPYQGLSLRSNQDLSIIQRLFPLTNASIKAVHTRY